MRSLNHTTVRLWIYVVAAAAFVAVGSSWNYATVVVQPPLVVSAPASQTAFVGSDVVFNVVAASAQPITYQWRFNDVPIAGATSATLLLTKVGLASSGVYTVVVTSSGISVVSPPAFLVVKTLPDCVAVPPGLVAWWRGDSNTEDEMGENSGLAIGGVTFGPGQVGPAFVFDGIGDAVAIGSPAALKVQSFTIESWIERADTVRATQDPGGNHNGVIFAWGIGGYGFALDNDGRLLLGKIGWSAVYSTQRITDRNFHHVAVVKDSGTVTFFVDGMPEAGITYDPGFSFDTSAAIGARGGDSVGAIWGAIDELSIFNRALATYEVQSIYAAGPAGKCALSIPPYVRSAPSDQTTLAGSGVILTVIAGGSQPRTYQWSRNNEPLPGATSATLLISNVQLTDAGTYTVLISNSAGHVSSSAILTVNPAPPCLPAPSGLVSWWRAEGNTLDELGNNVGTLQGNAKFGLGYTGLGFSFDGLGDAISLENLPSLQLQNFTIEAWVRRADSAKATLDPAGGNNGCILAGDWGSYALLVLNDGRLALGKIGESAVFSTAKVSDTAFHHIAVTKNGTTVVFYIDGVNETAPSYTVSFQVSSFAIGAKGRDFAASFFGTIDEVSLYSRALTPTELRSIYAARTGGKCAGAFPPMIVTQPVDQAGLVGSTASFNVVAGGSAPLSYQWRFNDLPIDGATAATLNMTSLGLANSGRYSVEVSNSQSSITSSDAILTVSFPPATLQVGSASAGAGELLIVPVSLLANGIENAMSFSLHFTPTLLELQEVTLASDASGAALLINNSQLAQGAIGIALSLPAGARFSSGNQELLHVRFKVSLIPNPTTTSIAFADQPTVRQLSDANAHPQSANYEPGVISIAGATFLGDVAPRPSGDQAVTATDWVLIGRFVARLDLPNSGELRRADCAPRATLGDGALTVSDWVQAGRYVAGLDPLTMVAPVIPGAPSAAASIQSLAVAGGRELHIGDGLLLANQCSLPISLMALGNENAVSFSVAFNPAELVYVSATLGSAATGGSLNINASQSASGQVAFVLALPTAQHLAAGANELVRIKFHAAAGVEPGTYPVAFTDQPVPREVSDADATAWPADYFDGSVALLPAEAHLFYNNSKWDGNQPGADSGDDAAIASDKVALRSGETASFANYTSYTKGINGIMIDLPTLPSPATLLSPTEDFTFRLGNTDDPSTWGVLITLPTITIRPGAGVSGSDRVTLIWPDGAIAMKWLQFTVLSTARTGLQSPEVFYFGNLIGECTGNGKVNVQDLAVTRQSSGQAAEITSVCDYDRSGSVNVADVARVRSNAGFSLILLQAP